jgi:hypothetical protein
MQNLIIKATPKSFDITCEAGLIEIKGCSIISDPKVFFKPVQTWISAYLKDPADQTIVNMKIDYIDSASTKYLFEILKALEKLNNTRRSINLNWYYDINDPEILELGEVLDGRINIPFNFIKF